MIQVYCNDEDGVNKWLASNTDREVISIQMAMNEQGEYIMVTYKTPFIKEYNYNMKCNLCGTEYESDETMRFCPKCR